MKNPNSNYQNTNNIAISIGDPAGIGTEIILKALADRDLSETLDPIIVGCRKHIDKTYSELIARNCNQIANPKNLKIKDIPMKFKLNLGEPSYATGTASFNWLTEATKVVLNGEAKALVTAPISKYAWNLAGHKYNGQTERLGNLTGTKSPSMLFTAISPNNQWRLNTLLATTHIPINEVTNKLTPELLISKLDELLIFCKQFNKSPKLRVAGLNPHAGEEGNIGKEEMNWIIPTLKKWQDLNPEVEIEGPIPPDTCWLPSIKAWNHPRDSNTPDGILAMYHDQGLIPVKLIAFENAVNTTLGLPFIRTSPDHGTAFDISKKRIANPTSMLEAIKTAVVLSEL